MALDDGASYDPVRVPKGLYGPVRIVGAWYAHSEEWRSTGVFFAADGRAWVYDEPMFKRVGRVRSWWLRRRCGVA